MNIKRPNWISVNAFEFLLDSVDYGILEVTDDYFKIGMTASPKELLVKKQWIDIRVLKRIIHDYFDSENSITNNI